MMATLFLLLLVMLAAFFTWTDVRYGYGLYRFRRPSIPTPRDARKGA